MTIPAEPELPASTSTSSASRRGPKLRVAQLPLPRLRRPDALLLVVDIQERLLPSVRFGPRVLERATRLALSCALLKIPIIATEQNPTRLGSTPQPLKSALDESPTFASPTFAKMQFSALTPQVARELEVLARPSVLLCGLESHVCILQSALDLLERGQRVFVARDAISSRHARDEDAALERMRAAGAIVTTSESALLELLGTADAPEFKSVLGLIK